MKIFVDFDDTLMHTSQMKEDVFSAHQLTPAEELRAHYRTFRQDYPFSIEQFSTYLCERGCDGKRLKDLFYQHAKQAERYVFADARSFLQSLQKAGHELVLLSFDTEPGPWQTPKITSSGLADHFNRVQITGGKKTDCIRELQLTEPFVFIDDKSDEIEAMRAEFPDALCLKHDREAPLMVHLDPITAFIESQR